MDHGRYDIQITPAAQKELDRLSRPMRNRIDAAIVRLADNPRPQGVRKLQGTEEDTYRIRVGNYRVVYRIYDMELIVLIVRIGDRKDIYRP
jgi:mRNA interferase RelE/StbE